MDTRSSTDRSPSGSSHRSGSESRSTLGSSKRAMVGPLARLEAQSGIFDAIQLPEEDEEEHRASKEIEDAVPNHLGRDGDDITTLSTSPGDRVGDKHEGEEACTGEVARAEG